jgi:outer membrane lipoprotein-sorting protein
MRLTGPLGFLSILLLSLSAAAQQPSTPQPVPQRDPLAVATLAQCLAAAGGQQALAAVQDYTATGTITYSWAGEEVQGSVTVRGRSAGAFRLDANLPQGARSWAVTSGDGKLREMDGTTKGIPFQNAINLGALSFPVAGIAGALADTSAVITYVDLVNIGASQVHQVRVERNLLGNASVDSSQVKLASKDYFIDPNTSLLLKTQDITYPVETYLQSYTHDVEFADYRQVSGLVVPFSITETISGQQTWTIQLNAVQLNAGLSDADFQL